MRFLHLLVDEFQDTNALQLGIVTSLAKAQPTRRAARRWLLR